MLTILTRPLAPPTAAICPFGETAKEVIPLIEGSRSGELGAANVDSFQAGVEDEISHRTKVESREVVKSCRPLGGGKIPQVTGIVCEESTVRVLPDGTAEH